MYLDCMIDGPGDFSVFPSVSRCFLLVTPVFSLLPTVTGSFSANLYSAIYIVMQSQKLSVHQDYAYHSVMYNSDMDKLKLKKP